MRRFLSSYSYSDLHRPAGSPPTDDQLPSALASPDPELPESIPAFERAISVAQAAIFGGVPWRLGDLARMSFGRPSRIDDSIRFGLVTTTAACLSYPHSLEAVSQAKGQITKDSRTSIPAGRSTTNQTSRIGATDRSALDVYPIDHNDERSDASAGQVLKHGGIGGTEPRAPQSPIEGPPPGSPTPSTFDILFSTPSDQPTKGGSTQSHGGNATASALPSVRRRDFAHRPSPLTGSPFFTPRPLNDLPSTTLSSETSTGPSPPFSILSYKPSQAYGPCCDSPRPFSLKNMRSSMPRPSMRFSRSVTPGMLCRISNGVCLVDEEHSCELQVEDEPSIPTIEEDLVLDAVPSVSVARPRKILIIGSTYSRAFRRTGTIYSANTIEGAENDAVQLAEAFESRGYFVEAMGMESFNREDILRRIARFVADAEWGDIRAIAFTGHGHTTQDGTTMIIPPDCPTREMAITRSEWEQNIKGHAKPGTIIFSIMAHCFSGDFMQQNQDCRKWASTAPAFQSSTSPARTDSEPVFITFTSSAYNEPSFESAVERHLQEYAMDHFIHALVTTIRDDDIRTWAGFFARFGVNFNRARSTASWADAYSKALDKEDARKEAPSDDRARDFIAKIRSLASEFATSWPELAFMNPANPQRTLRWRITNIQTPTFSASKVVEYSDIF